MIEVDVCLDCACTNKLRCQQCYAYKVFDWRREQFFEDKVCGEIFEEVKP